MTPPRPAAAYDAFERQLLEAGRADTPAVDCGQAWQRFSVAAAGMRGERGLDGVVAGGSAIPTASWLLASGVLGAALSAGVLVAGAWLSTPSNGSEQREGRSRSVVPPGAPPPTTSPVGAAQRSPAAPPTPTDAAVGAAQHRSESESGERPAAPLMPHNAVPRAASASAKPAAPRPTASARATPKAASTLAAETLLLDQARLAYQIGAYADALRLVDKLHRNYPSSALLPDAELVAIRTLKQQERQRAAQARAHRFLERYPRDPQASQVRALLP